jgi:hypothetical protein
MRARVECALYGVLLVLLPIAGRAQPADKSDVPPTKITVFLDCAYCVADRIAQETPFVTFVRDRTDAQVHVLVTYETAGNQYNYIVEFIGQHELKGRRDTLNYRVPLNVAVAEDQEKMARTIRLGLASFAAKAGAAPMLKITYSEPVGPIAALPTNDPWNHWAFTVSGGINGFGERSSEMTMFMGSVSAERATASSRIAVSYSNLQMKNRFDIGDTRIESTARDVMGSYALIRSTGRHWGAGLTGSFGSSIVGNRRLRLTVTPSVEYNFFPYEEYSRRSVILQFSSGLDQSEYHTETIYFRKSDALPIGVLSLRASATEQWGSLSASVDGSRYFDQRGKGHVASYLMGNFRLFKGFSLTTWGSYNSIHDQLSLPRGDATVEEVILRQRELATSYRYSLSMGLSYTFGSALSAAPNTVLRGGIPGFH